MTETTKPEPWIGAVAITLERRGRDDRGALADLRRGLTPHTEGYALPYVGALLEPGDQHLEKVVLRTVGIVANNRDTRHSDDPALGLGGSLSDLHLRLTGKRPDGDATGTLTRRVLALPAYDFETAVQAIDGLVNYCGAQGVPVNFYAVARLLAHWGNGVTDKSIAARNRVVRDFFVHKPAKLEQTDTNERG